MNRLAWIILGLLFSGLVVALAAGGWGTGGALDWWKAKFLGQGKTGPGLTGSQMFPPAALIPQSGTPLTSSTAGQGVASAAAPAATGAASVGRAAAGAVGAGAGSGAPSGHSGGGSAGSGSLSGIYSGQASPSAAYLSPSQIALVGALNKISVALGGKAGTPIVVPKVTGHP